MFLTLSLPFGMLWLLSCSQGHIYTLKEWDSIHVKFFLLKISRIILPRADIWGFFFFFFFFFLHYSAEDEAPALGRLMLFMKFCGWGNVFAKVMRAVFHAHLFDRSYWGVMSTSTKPFHLSLSSLQWKEGLSSILILNEEVVIGVKLLVSVLFLLKK